MKFYQILPKDQALAIAENVKGLNWSPGKARTRELTGTVKQNREILDNVLLQTLGKRIINDTGIQLDHIPLQLHPPKFSRYSDGEHYSLHTDAPWMAKTRTDLSCTLWLSDDYDGGDLVIAGERFRGEPGQCLIYDCGEPHEVTPVTRGDRICAVTWIQSRIRDPIKRKYISDFRKFLSNFEDSPLFIDGSRLYSALLRRWIE